MDSSSIFPAVNAIIYDIANNGNAALKKYAQKFDGIILKNLSVTTQEINAAIRNIDPSLKKAILQAKNNIHKFIHIKPFLILSPL